MNANPTRRRQPAFYYKGKRKSVNLRLPDEICDGVSQAARLARTRANVQWDHACRRFLADYRDDAPLGFEAAVGNAPYRIVWIDQKLYRKLAAISKKRGVPMARVIHTVGARFVSMTKT
jgi:hypothetical protein